MSALNRRTIKHHDGLAIYNELDRSWHIWSDAEDQLFTNPELVVHVAGFSTYSPDTLRDVIDDLQSGEYENPMVTPEERRKSRNFGK